MEKWYPNASKVGWCHTLDKLLFSGLDKYLGHSNNCVIQLTVIYLVDNVIPVLKKLGRISL